LGVASGEITRLGLPDSAVSSCEEELTAALAPLVSRDTLLLAPWICDPHPDHEACGRAARRLAEDTGCELISYFFWAWHRFDTTALAVLSLRKFELDEQLQEARAAALAHHRSQLYRDDGSPVLPESLLAPARRPFETFIVDEK
jgi:LmbE family N-acetylglucosaminyl deacetylase